MSSAIPQPMATYGDPGSLLFDHKHPVPAGDDPYNITVAEAASS